MADWIIETLSTFGYLGVVFLMFLENIFPPIPSELIMPFAGYVASRGDLHPVGVVLAGSFGSLLGTLPWYYAGLWLGRDRVHRFCDRHGWWLTVTAEDMERAERWFARYGYVAVLVGRLIPAIRTVISAPAGLERMPLLPFLAISALGTIAWTSILTAAGYVLEANYERVEVLLDPVTTILVAIIVLVYLYRLARGYMARRRERR